MSRRRAKRSERSVVAKPEKVWLRDYSRSIHARYDAARTSIENERWWAAADGLAARTANSATVRKVLRQRSRYETHEANSYARGIVVAKANDVIGTGAVLQVASQDRAWNQAVELRWNEWTKATLLWQKLWTAFVAYVVDGETFIERRNNPKLQGVTLTYEISEADLWSDPWDVGTDPLYSDGVRIDKHGNVESYKRLRTHPGESIASMLEPMTVSADAVIHHFRRDRPGQMRGVPHLTPALPLFAELRRYRLATMAAAETAANFAALLYTDAPIEPAEVDAFQMIDLERRALMSLPSGWKMEQLRAEHPNTTHFEFVKSVLMEVGRCLLTPLNIALGSSGDYNFSSARLDYILYWGNCDIERNNFACCVLDRIWRDWLEEATLIPGYLPVQQPTDFARHAWRWPPRYPLDVMEQAQADSVYYNMGHLADEDVFARMAVDAEVQYDKLGRMVTARMKRGLPLPGEAQTLSHLQRFVTQEQLAGKRLLGPKEVQEQEVENAGTRTEP